MEFTDVLMFAGAAMQGYSLLQGVVSFEGALISTIGTNLEFTQPNLSIPKVIIVTMTGYYVGRYFAKGKQNDKDD
jgi:hypothetical protein